MDTDGIYESVLFVRCPVISEVGKSSTWGRKCHV